MTAFPPSFSRNRKAVDAYALPTSASLSVLLMKANSKLLLDATLLLKLLLVICSVFNIKQLLSKERKRTFLSTRTLKQKYTYVEIKRIEILRLKLVTQNESFEACLYR
mmetsp:Transcript_1155/g.1347  ORF Transcript_1155/g.1347 Transcript_1155/m.1347 type:complete len:108 (+) Transcript_1155:170-493(+)